MVNQVQRISRNPLWKWWPLRKRNTDIDVETESVKPFVGRQIIGKFVHNPKGKDYWSFINKEFSHVRYSDIGGLARQIRELREIEWSLQRSELFQGLCEPPPKGWLLYGPSGCGKNLLASAVANELNVNFIKVVSSDFAGIHSVDSGKLIITTIFDRAKRCQPCIVFLDKIDLIAGGTKFPKDMAELLNQMDNLDATGQVKIMMASNEPDKLNPALLRPGRLDRKIEVPVPDEEARFEILKIRFANQGEDIDYEEIVELTGNLTTRADLQEVCNLAGSFALCANREAVLQEDFMMAVKKFADDKKLGSKY